MTLPKRPKLTYVSNLHDLPKDTHFAVIENDSVYIEGDERSRTNPGHGYGPETKHYLSYIAFPSEEDFQLWIQQREEHDQKSNFGREPYLAIQVKPVKIERTTTIKIS